MQWRTRFLCTYLFKKLDIPKRERSVRLFIYRAMQFNYIEVSIVKCILDKIWLLFKTDYKPFSKIIFTNIIITILTAQIVPEPIMIFNTHRNTVLISGIQSVVRLTPITLRPKERFNRSLRGCPKPGSFDS